MTNTTPISEQWKNCYDDSWKGAITDASFAHPAKYSRGLIERIYAHCVGRGYLKRGDTVVDPFGGVALGGIIGACFGIKWIGVELEEKFVTLGNANIALHAHKWETFGDPLPRIVQGDSRKLREVLGPVLAECVVSSPPYTEEVVHGRPSKMTQGIFEGRTANTGLGEYGQTDGQLGSMKPGDVDAVIGSPPFAESQQVDNRKTLNETHRNPSRGRIYTEGSGSQGSDGNLASMPTGSVEAIVSSPPWQDGTSGHDHEFDKKRSGGPVAKDYGDTTGQLAALPPGCVDACVSSPPYINQETCGNRRELEAYDRGERRNRHYSRSQECAPGNGGCDEKRQQGASGSQGKSGQDFDGNAETPLVGVLGDNGDVEREAVIASGSVLQSGDAAQSGDPLTFWSAAAEIVRECYAILKPGGIAVWVVKSFVRAGKIQDFPGDWRRLCEHAGFTTVEEVHASLVKEETHAGLFGEHKTRKERKSFFRRLHEKKRPDLSIDYEVVYFMRKPAGNGHIDVILSSPPYAQSLHSENGIDYAKSTATPTKDDRVGLSRKKGHPRVAHKAPTGTKPSIAREAIGSSYGDTPGNLGSMPEGTPP